MVLIRWSKTLQYRQKVLKTPVLPFPDKRICPVFWLNLMLDLIPGKPQNPLFSIHKNNQNVPICSITLHVNYKIAVFVNFQVLTMAKMDTKVKNQVLTNILHCSVDREMVLQAQELAPSGIMLVILSLNASIYKQNRAFNFWHLKGSGQDLKNYLKVSKNTHL